MVQKSKRLTIWAEFLALSMRAEIHGGRGFVVYGRGFGANTYSATLVTVCATPAKPSRRGAARRGFSTKREAQALADAMNQASAPNPAC
jgi:hypothetical protein